MNIIKKTRTTLLFIFFCIALVGCKKAQQVDEVEDVNNTEVEIIEDTSLEEVSKISEHEYVPDKSGDSYYSILEDGVPLEVKTQESGTCWTCAITSSMEASYYRNYGEEASFDASDLCLKIYDDEKDEGWFLNYDKLFYGGYNWLAFEYLPNGYNGYFLKDAWLYDEKNSIDEIKDGIKKHGPVAIAICDNTSFKRSFDGYFTMNDSDPEHLDHAVIIVGWDDNFPKDYFKVPAKENGAWLCQNSKSKGWGNDGLYFVSYESLIQENSIFSVTKEYNDVAYYDCGNEKRILTSDKTSVANVFEKKGKLVAVGTYTGEDYQKYNIEILDGEFGELVTSIEGVSDIKGYHIVDLPTPIDVEKYTIVISFEGSAAVEGESYSLDDDIVSYVASSSLGQSFVLINDEWIDLASDDIKEKLKIDFAPNNACIKAYYK